MVFSAKFPWAKIRKATKPHIFKFNPFEDEEVAISPRIERMLDFLELDDPPHPENLLELESTWSEGPKLRHPRPVPTIALRDALSRFEEIAQSSDGAWNGGSYSSSPCPSELGAYGVRLVTRPEKLLPFESRSSKDTVIPSLNTLSRVVSTVGNTWLTSELTHSLAEAHATQNACLHPPASDKPHPQPAGPRPSGGLACLSPGFLEHFPGYARRGEPPRPTFVLQRVAGSEASRVTRGSKPTSESNESEDGGKLEDVSYSLKSNRDEANHNVLSIVSKAGMYSCKADDISGCVNEQGYEADDEESIASASCSSSPNSEALLSPISAIESFTPCGSTSYEKSIRLSESKLSQWMLPIATTTAQWARPLTFANAWDTRLYEEVEARIIGDD